MCQLLGENSADATDGWVGEEKRGGQFFPQIDPLVLIISLGKGAKNKKGKNN